MSSYGLRQGCGGVALFGSRFIALAKKATAKVQWTFERARGLKVERKAARCEAGAPLVEIYWLKVDS